MPNGQELGARNVERLRAWFDERAAWGSEEWDGYTFRGELNRTLIAQECDFTRSAFQTNAALLAILKEWETRLQRDGFVRPARRVAPGQTAKTGAREPGTSGEIIVVSASDLERLRDRVNRMEVENANLREELAASKRRLERYAYLDRHLHETGSLIHP